VGRKLHAVVGDVHGHHDALRRLEDRVVRSADREGFEPVFVSVGDLVDRGPATASVVGHLRRGVAAGTHIAVMGNHEAMMLAAIHANAPHLLADAGCTLPPWVVPFSTVWERKRSQASKWLPEPVYVWYATLNWLAQGGVPTLESYGVTDPTRPSTWTVDPEDLRFLASLPLSFTNTQLFVTHAMLAPEAVADLSGDDAEKRQSAADTALWGRTLPRARPDPIRTHVSGHSPMGGVRRRPRIGVVQVDTGACLGRRLSAWCAETDQVFSISTGSTGT
jgi:hypothetical protein